MKEMPSVGTWIVSNRNKLDLGFVLFENIVLWVGDPWYKDIGRIQCNEPNLEILKNNYKELI